MVGSNKQAYSFNLGRNPEEELVAFDGDILLVLSFSQKINLSYVEGLQIIDEIESSADKYVELTAIELKKARDLELSQLESPTIDITEGL